MYVRSWAQLSIKVVLLTIVKDKDTEMLEKTVVSPGWRRFAWKQYHEAISHLMITKILSCSIGQEEDVHRWSTNCGHCLHQLLGGMGGKCINIEKYFNLIHT